MQYFLEIKIITKKILMGTHRVHGCGYALPARASVDLYKNPVLKAPYLMLRFLLITWEESFFFFSLLPNRKAVFMSYYGTWLQRRVQPWGVRGT